MPTYVVTGVHINGKRFRPIVTDNYWHADGISINLWRGSVWMLRENGTRKLLWRVNN